MTRKWKLAAGAGALILAFAAGRFSAREPDRKEEEHATTQRVDVFGEREQWVLRRDVQQTRKSSTYRKRDRTVEPSGRTQESETELTLSAETLRQITDATGQREAQGATSETATMERKVEVRTPLPDWRIGGMVGYSGGMLYGGQVERRVLGPVSVGAWGMGGAAAAGGLSLSLDL